MPLSIIQGSAGLSTFCPLPLVWGHFPAQKQLQNGGWGRTQAVAQLVKNLPAMQETWVLPLGWEDPLEKGKATHSSVLAWRIPWTV